MTLGIWQLVILIFYLAIIIIPFWKIFPRAGWHSGMNVLMIVPIINVVLLWVLAFKRWPGDG